jgi:hypothetical protein
MPALKGNQEKAHDQIIRRPLLHDKGTTPTAFAIAFRHCPEASATLHEGGFSQLTQNSELNRPKSQYRFPSLLLQGLAALHWQQIFERGWQMPTIISKFTLTA